IVVDDYVSCIGSANFNHRSMLKDDEVNMTALSAELAELLVNHFEEDLTYCDEIKKDQWEQRSLMQRGLEVVSKFFKQQI
ncbi:phospholipase D-like domain-containing protein, partial [Fodinibius sp.]|uniref:phospholipase D-like domain-containing protein n=1 Tax=Fodinibius sp. TaxID=1872440 RepID=UPI00356316BC